MGLVGACGFKPTNGPVTDGPVDTHDALDATIPTRFLVTSAEWTQTVGSTKFVVYPFDGNQLGGACITQPAADDVHALVGHPTRPYVYAVESGVQGASVDCSLVSVSNVGDVGNARAAPQIALKADATVGFSTYDGAGALAVFRFTANSTGVPTAISGTANGPSESGAVTLDEATSQLLVGGASTIFSYALVGPQLDLPGTASLASSCGQPVGLLVSGAKLLVLCGDTAQIQRYDLNPFAFDSPAGGIGAVDAVRALPGDRAVAARIAPPQLVVMDLGGGTPTWTDGPVMSSRVTAMATSQDGSLVVTARQADATSSEIAVWRISGQSVTLVNSQLTAHLATGIAITPTVAH